MRRSTVRYVLDLLLLTSVVGVVATGIFVDRLDLHEFRLHSRIGYAMTVLVAVHLYFHWRPFVRARSAGRRTGEVALQSSEHRRNTGEPTTSTAGRAGRSRRSVLTSLAAGTAGGALGWIARSEASPGRFDGGDVGFFYHRESSLGVNGLLSNLLDWGRRPARYKGSAGVDSIALPPVDRPPDMSVAEAIGQRRSRREYADRAMTAQELAWVVHAATGITSDDGRRTAPSAGALYPIETYVAVNRVEGIDAGVYHVDVRQRALDPVRVGSVGGDLVVAGLGQNFLRTAPVVLVLTGYFQRTRWKYHQRHYRYVCWEAGHIAQNVYLAGEAAGLGACMVGAFLDGPVNDLLRVDGREEAALGVVAVGPIE